MPMIADDGSACPTILGQGIGLRVNPAGLAFRSGKTCSPLNTQRVQRVAVDYPLYLFLWDARQVMVCCEAV